jgi:uncharacterized surface protein with fasciclin (FAS1) repeats
MRRAIVTAVSAALVLGGLAAPAGAQEDPGTIVEIAQSNEDLSTLVTAVTEAGLVETLSGEGPFTVFAPTNAAFEALPEGTLDQLLADPEGALTDVLQLHVISGEVDSAAAAEAAGGTVETLGGPISVEMEGENLVVGGATVVQADIQASNGVIHVIDSVITEPASAAPPAPDAEDDQAGDQAAAPMPNRVDTGDSGLAAEDGFPVVLAVLAGLALMGVGTSGFVLARRRIDS